MPADHRPSHPALSRRQFTLGVPLAASLFWSVPVLAASTSAQEQRRAMGTVVDIRVNHDDPAIARRAMDAAWTEIERLEGMMSRYQPGNPLSALHASAGIQAVQVPPELMAVLRMAQAVSTTSHGAFDATVGSIQQWDFRPGHYSAPSTAELRAELPLVGQSRGLVLDTQRQTAYLTQRGMRLDLGGVAKLPILQAAVDTLTRHGIRSAMVNGGGDVVVRGGNQGQAWRIGLRDPLHPDRLLGTVALVDGIVAASGDYERCFERDGQVLHHIINPRTGYPSEGPHGVVLVSSDMPSVNGMGATVMVAGTKFGQQQLRALPGVDGLIVNRDRSTWMSAGMRQRLRA